MQLKELGELNLIKKLLKQFETSNPDVVQGIGDDAAVTRLDEKRCLLLTTDMLVEDVHFSLSYTSAYVLGKKAVSVSLSDIAAMGGTPKFLLTSIAIPKNTSSDFIDLFYKGVKERIDEFDVALIGGNTSSSPDKIVIEAIVIGEALNEDVVFRSGARAGDIIYATGFLGDSSLGLDIWKNRGDKSITDPFMRDAMLEHIDPAPRVKEGKLITEKKLATSMIDISDGLMLDLRHIAEESNVGAKIDLTSIPLSTAMKRHLIDKPDDIMLSLTGGEDYELLFTAMPENKEKIQELSKEINLPITQIGEIVSKEEGVKVFDKDGCEMKIDIEGFEHFRQDA